MRFKHTSVRIPPEDWEAILAYASARGLSKQMAIRELYKLGLEAQKTQQHASIPRTTTYNPFTGELA